MSPLNQGRKDPAVRIGLSPETRRQMWQKLMWVGIWLAFMTAPIGDLLDGNHTIAATVLGWLGLAAFVTVYLALVLRHTARPLAHTTVYSLLGFLAGLAVVLSLTLGASWLVLFVYVSVSCGATLPITLATWSILVTTATMTAIGTRATHVGDVVPDLVIPAILGGFAMTGVRHLIRTSVELREARATVAQLAANEERLRMARDLHDLLGHSLSLITLKSELAGRMLPGHPDQAAQQVADIEQVSRQALVDVRAAVSGYRRATLPAELAGARTALSAAGIEADVPTKAPEGLPAAEEEVLAWVLREAATNVVRHSGARHCTVTIGERQTLDGRFLELRVQDDGKSGSASPVPGNGLTGLAERLEKVSGVLETEPGRKGFTLVARIPLIPDPPTTPLVSGS
ncbi:two-component sensor histidine kinase [Streptomyces violascens]|uniref:Two-component sensor histidine kinase n=2 Tax=Streptomyces violascens TaxID=67381 RepID=A0ABQ3R0U5_9ACTN|nr:two-component sensor histidine kinase [Streptomyces violascens]GHI43145.1 two-component sensor histidine kinase [Streptomyces violascens]